MPEASHKTGAIILCVAAAADAAADEDDDADVADDDTEGDGKRDIVDYICCNVAQQVTHQLDIINANKYMCIKISGS